MAYALVHDGVVSTTTSAAALAVSIGNVTSGNLLVVYIAMESLTATATITDNLGNSYTQAGSYSTLSGAGRMAWFYAVSASSGSCTVTGTLSGATRWVMFPMEWSGGATSSPLDGTVSTTGTSTTPASGTIPVAGTADLVLSAFATQTGTGVYTTPSSPFTSLYHVIGLPGLAVGFQISKHIGAAASEACTYSNNPSAAWVAGGVSFLVASSPPPPPPPVSFYPQPYGGPPVLTPLWYLSLPPKTPLYAETGGKPPPPLPPTPPIPIPPPPPPNVPPPLPPIPPVPAGYSYPQVINTPEVYDQRLRLHVDEVCSILNSLLRSGQIRLIGPDQFQIIPALYGGLSGSYP